MLIAFTAVSLCDLDVLSRDFQVRPQLQNKGSEKICKFLDCRDFLTVSLVVVRSYNSYCSVLSLLGSCLNSWLRLVKTP